MFLGFLGEYQNFIIVLIVIIVLIFAAYFLFAKPKKEVPNEEQNIVKDKGTPSENEQTAEEQSESTLGADGEEAIPLIITSFADLRDDDSNKPRSFSPEDDEDQGKKRSKKTESDFKKLDDFLDDVETEEEKSLIEAAFETEEDTSPKRYHVLYRKEDDVWYVKREGTDRITKVLNTQKEAIAFATIKAINQNTTVVVHKRDGKIRKYAL